MPTPFPSFVENATLLFDVPTGELTQDEVGNAIAETVSVRVTAMLKAKVPAYGVAIQRAPEIDEAATYLEGFCLEPMQLPLSILPKNWAKATWSGIPGFFYLNDPINPPYGREGIGAVLEQSAGTKIVGWFQTSRAEYA